MSIILSVETSTPICSVALHNGGELMACKELFADRSHSSLLTVLVEEILTQAKIALNDVSAFAIAKGPGSYTGLRIGTSTVKGFCYGLDKPLIAVNTLKGMAVGMVNKYGEDMLYCPMIDARRMEVYCLMMTRDGTIEMPTRAVIVDESSFSSELKNGKVLFFGNGAEKCKTLLESESNALFDDGGLPSAIHIGQEAFKKFEREEFEDVAYFEPFYLKAFKAGKPKQELKR